MLLSFWSPKGGSGCSVTVAAVGRILAEQGRDVVLVDMRGDASRILGVGAPPVESCELPDPIGSDIEGRYVRPKLHLVDLGALDQGVVVIPALVEALVRAAASGRDVLVDFSSSTLERGCGIGAERSSREAGPAMSIVVTRSCYLALHSFTRAGREADGVLLVEEPGRALGAADVSAVLRAPVLAQIPFDASVARSVDAGLLAWRLPEVLVRSLSPLCDRLLGAQ